MFWAWMAARERIRESIVGSMQKDLGYYVCVGGWVGGEVVGGVGWRGKGWAMGGVLGRGVGDWFLYMLKMGFVLYRNGRDKSHRAVSVRSEWLLLVPVRVRSSDDVTRALHNFFQNNENETQILLYHSHKKVLQDESNT